MANDPTDLIRAVDEMHVQAWDNCLNACCSGEECRLRTEVCRECGDPWPCEVRRLRDALEASETDVHHLRTELGEWISRWDQMQVQRHKAVQAFMSSAMRGPMVTEGES